MMKITKCVTVIFALVACAAAALAEGWPQTSNDRFDALLKAARSEESLLIGGPAYLDPDFIEAFEQDTGLEVDFTLAVRSEGRKRFFTEAASDAPIMDVYFSGTSPINLVADGHLMDIADSLVLEEVTASENWLGGKIPFVDSGTAKFLPSPGMYRSGLIVVNSNIIDPDSLKNWDDLLDPSLEGKILLFTPARAGGGLTFISHLLQQRGENYTTALLTRQASLTSDYRQLVDGVAKGAFPISLTPLSVHIERYREQGVEYLTVVELKGIQPYTVGGFSVIAIADRTSSPNAAKVFANWYLSKKGQAAYSAVARTPSARTDLTEVTWPEYIEIDSVEFTDTYNQIWMDTVKTTGKEFVETLELK